MNIKKHIAILISFLVLSITGVQAADVTQGKNANGVILNGYDAVAYFTQSKPVEGSANYTAVHNNAIYQFSSAKNRDAFNENPSKYEPQFGGFCAYGTALGKKFEVNGKAFEVVGGKLYVNKDENVYDTWVKEKSSNIEKAHQQWPEIKHIAASKL